MRDEKQAGQITWENEVAAHENLHKFLEHLSRNRSRYEENIRLIFEVEEGAKPMARKVTEQLLEQVDGADFGYARHVLLCALKYMSEDDVADMAKFNELLWDEEEQDDA